jgi:hypothetical protein
VVQQIRFAGAVLAVIGVEFRGSWAFSSRMVSLLGPGSRAAFAATGQLGLVGLVLQPSDTLPSGRVSVDTSSISTPAI